MIFIAGVGISDVSVADSADVPQKPSSPRLLRDLAIAPGEGLGAVLGTALAQSDEAIADPSEMGRRLGLSLLGSVPKMAGAVTPREELRGPTWALPPRTARRATSR